MGSFRTLLLLVFACTTLLVPARAQALTLDLTAGTVTITDDVGESNDISVTEAAGTYTIQSNTAQTFAVTGLCGGGGTTTVTCNPVTAFTVNLNSFNDAFDANSIAIPVTIDGGTGDDSLTTGGGDDFLTGGDGGDALYANGGTDNLDGGLVSDALDGGLGDDTFTCGGGSLDVIDYSLRSTNPIVADMSAGSSGNGEAGESDNYVDSCEKLVGGTAAAGDTLTGNSANNTIDGADGDDIIDGAGGTDTLTGGDGADGFAEGDSANGADSIDGGAGSDTVDYSARTLAVTVDLGAASGDGESGENDNVNPSVETVLGGSAGDTLTGPAVSIVSYDLEGNDGADTLTGGGFNDTVSGGDGTDTLIGGNGDDTITGGAGNDAFTTATTDDGSDTITGNAGTDTLSYATRTTPVTLTLGAGANDGEAGEADNLTDDIETITGSSTATNTITGLTNPLTITGGTGDDVLTGGAGADTFTTATTDDGSDTITGNAGTDTLSYATRTTPVTITLGAGANDGEAGEADNLTDDIETITGSSTATNTITGLTNPLTITGGAGNDTLTGGTGSDTIAGGAGNDTYVARSTTDGADTLVDSAGTDTASYALRTATVIVKLDALANDGASGEGDLVASTIEKVLGGSGADTLTGSASANTLTGNGGKDILSGGAGKDALTGGAGNDKLTGGAAKDTVDGGAGNDIILIKDKVNGETAKCGAGKDTATIDKRDKSSKCEKVKH